MQPAPCLGEWESGSITCRYTCPIRIRIIIQKGKLHLKLENISLTTNIVINLIRLVTFPPHSLRIRCALDSTHHCAMRTCRKKSLGRLQGFYLGVMFGYLTQTFTRPVASGALILNKNTSKTSCLQDNEVALKWERM